MGKRARLKRAFLNLEAKGLITVDRRGRGVLQWYVELTPLGREVQKNIPTKEDVR